MKLIGSTVRKIIMPGKMAAWGPFQAVAQASASSRPQVACRREAEAEKESVDSARIAARHAQRRRHEHRAEQVGAA
jgi:hypothetical protein